MQKSKTGQAGTLMSCDALITFRAEKAQNNITLPNEIDNETVKKIFNDITIKMQGPSITRYVDSVTTSVLEVLKNNNIDKCAIDIIDRGALDFILRARLQTAIDRALTDQALIDRALSVKGA